MKSKKRPTESSHRLYARVASEKGKIDILFAGADTVDPQSLAETTEESFDKVFAINTRGLAFTVKKALPLLNDGGAIIVITSIAENKGIFGFTGSKNAGVDKITFDVIFPDRHL